MFIAYLMMGDGCAAIATKVLLNPNPKALVSSFSPQKMKKITRMLVFQVTLTRKLVFVFIKLQAENSQRVE